MGRGAMGAFAQGLGSGLQFGSEQKERREDRAQRDREIDILASQASNPLPPIPDYTPPPSYRGGATTDIFHKGRFDGPVGPRKALGAVPDFYTSERAADETASATPSAGGKHGTFWDLLAKKEGAGNYSTLFGHSQKEGGKFAGVDVSRMTIGQASKFAAPDGEYGQWVKSQVGRVATPMGAPQIVGTTLRRTAKAMGLSDDTPFNEDTQRQMATYLAQQRISRASSQAGKRAGLRAEWEGFKHVSDKDLDRVIQELGT